MITRINKIRHLEKQKNVLQKEIYKLTQAEEEEVVLPKCRALVGVCLKSKYGDARYAKLLEILEDKKLGIYFLMEEFNTTEQGSVLFTTNTCYPYTNKEWWDADIPISGWKRIPEAQYDKQKAKAVREFKSMNILRAFTIKRR